MSTTPEQRQQKVVKIAQDLLSEENKQAITPAVIERAIDQVLRMKPEWGEGLDRQAVVDELIRRFSLWIGQDATLSNTEGHRAWLVTDRKRDWRYWPLYREWLEEKLSIKAIDALDNSTDAVLSLLEDPKRDGPWDRRGLVVGHVQSGKTSHYSGLICKAADSGYKIIIVLAGLHNNLRSQTQMRLEEAFLGFKTPLDGDFPELVGVGTRSADPSIQPNCATNRTNGGDFNARNARSVAISPEQRPWLFVVKKNKTVLERLVGWIRNRVADVRDRETGRRIVTNLPLLVIDDEADHASVDTREIPLDADGNPDTEHEPAVINRLVRRVLNSFSRSAYVGYTATPFANIFIHERAETREDGPDLFPSAFITNLAAPSNYVGPVKVFGVRDEQGRRNPLPLVRRVSDHGAANGAAGWMPADHRNGHRPLHAGNDELPPSLQDAIGSFFLACAARRIRGQGNAHCSMLVHVTRFTSVQAAVCRQVEEWVKQARQRLARRIDHEALLSSLHALWETDFVPTSAVIASTHPDLAGDREIAWAEIEAVIADVVSDIRVRTINGSAKDALDYVENEETGLKVIAIGGDKLARGLTLEGLTVSYFLRASKMYDTLMQMGRWFGYRPRYLDLCRLFTTDDLIEWFGHITDASEELREEFDYMEAIGGTPRDYGLKVQSHPVLMVTSRLKMRTARDLQLSFSGQLLETVTFHTEQSILQSNLAAARQLVVGLGEPEVDPERLRDGARPEKWSGYLWSGVNADAVTAFLDRYRTHPEAHKVNSALLTEFIRSMTAHGELTDWTVALIGGGDGGDLTVGPGVSVDMLVRNPKPVTDWYSIGRLMSPRDEAIDLDKPAWDLALAETRRAFHADAARNAGRDEPTAPNGPAVRHIRGFGGDGVPPHPERGLLFLYVIDPKAPGLAALVEGVIGFAVSFPASSSGTKVTYKVANLYWEQQYGGAD